MYVRKSGVIYLKKAFFQDDIPQNMVLVARETKQKPSSSGTLDPIGGGNLVRIVDSDIETKIYRSLESLLENQVKTVNKQREHW